MDLKDAQYIFIDKSLNGKIVNIRQQLYQITNHKDPSSSAQEEDKEGMKVPQEVPSGFSQTFSPL